jgi:hypothetical protein
VPQHKSFKDRIENCKRFIEEFDYKVPFYIDFMDNSFNESYHIWPDKCLMLIKDVIVYTGTLDESGSRSFEKGYSWIDVLVKLIEDD